MRNVNSSYEFVLAKRKALCYFKIKHRFVFHTVLSFRHKKTYSHCDVAAILIRSQTARTGESLILLRINTGLWSPTGKYLVKNFGPSAAEIALHTVTRSFRV